MTNVANEEHRVSAIQSVERFVRRFGESYRFLAYHAALPLVLTPELVNYLRNEFLRGEQVPWVAEVDLLLSDLCSQVGYELYAMDTHVRAYLLEQMEQDPRFGKRRMQEVAQVLISYVSYLSRLNPGRRQQEIEAQRWAAMVYLGDKECKKAAREIAESLLETSIGNDSKNFSQSGIRAELGRLTRITEELSRPLQEEESLLKYARLVQQILRNPGLVNPEELRGSYQVADMELKFPDRLLPEPLAEIVAASRGTVTQLEGFPPLQDKEYESSTIVLLDSIELLTQQFEVAEVEISIFQTFEFITAKLERKQKPGELFQRSNPFRRNEETGEAQRLIEELSASVTLEMVLITPGEFMMGAAPGEEHSRSNEQPQHKVTISETFLMGRYPVTREQWQAVVTLPQVNRELKVAFSRLRDKRPLEGISWEEAKEFCARLSQHTNREYRLPTEAEWEYACRAGTKTPFHYGETITTELANYDGNYVYGAGVKGEYREKTTEVGEFPANEFGLCDMHGQVWEWCEDDWHENYDDAPSNGSAWLTGKSNSKVIRGGSWSNSPDGCRSAYRGSTSRDNRNLNLGFRVVCVVPRTT